MIIQLTSCDPPDEHLIAMQMIINIISITNVGTLEMQRDTLEMQRGGTLVIIGMIIW